MTFKDMLENILIDIDEEMSDGLVVSKLRKFINRAYKELAKREVLSKTSNAYFDEGLCSIPSTAIKVYSVKDDSNNYIAFKLEGRKIVANYEGDAQLIYSYIPDDMTDDGDEPLTSLSNIEFIMNYAKYLYFMSDVQMESAKMYKVECETFKVVKQGNSIPIINVYGGF